MYCFIVGKKRGVRKSCKSILEEMSSSSDSSKISTDRIRGIVDKFMSSQMRESTSRTYLSIWHQFNLFLIQLDQKPKSWENRTTLFIAYLVGEAFSLAL